MQRSELVRPGSADSKQLRELYKGVNVGRSRGTTQVRSLTFCHLLLTLHSCWLTFCSHALLNFATQTSGGKVDANMLVQALDSVEHTEAQLKSMRRIMQLCDPKPSSKLAAANCRALAAAGGIPVLVRLLTCGATQLEWGAVLSLGSIAAFDNSTNAGSKHEIRQHGGIGDFVAMLWHHSLGCQKLSACAIANMAHNAWPEYGTLQQEIAQEVRIARSNGLGGFERLLQLLEGKPDDVTEWAAAALCNLSLCDEDSREHIFFGEIELTFSSRLAHVCSRLAHVLRSTRRGDAGELLRDGGRFFPSFSAIFNRKMQKLPLFSWILIRNEGKNRPGQVPHRLAPQAEYRYENLTVGEVIAQMQEPLPGRYLQASLPVQNTAIEKWTLDLGTHFNI